jgi:hypothetical protein
MKINTEQYNITLNEALELCDMFDYVIDVQGTNLIMRQEWN